MVVPKQEGLSNWQSAIKHIRHADAYRHPTGQAACQVYNLNGAY